MARESPRDLRELPSIGEDLAGKIETIVTTGELPLLRRLRRTAPRGAVELMHIPGIGEPGVCGHHALRSTISGITSPARCTRTVSPIATVRAKLVGDGGAKPQP
jgi:hypothetical protein